MSEVFTILVVEDDEPTRTLLVQYLRDITQNVISAATMNEGLRALTAARFDVLICDIRLPDGNGWELLQNAPPGAVQLAISMSGFGRPADKAKSTAAGYAYHLVKPFDPDELNQILVRAKCAF